MYRVALVLVAACGSTTVYKVSDKPNSGIPFFRRIAVHKEAVHLAQRWLRVDVMLTARVPTVEAKDKVVWNDSKQTVTAYFKESESQKVNDQLVKLANVHSYKEAVDAVAKFQASGDATPPEHENLLPLWDGLVKWKLNPKDQTNASFDKSLVSDQCAIDRMASSDEEFINVEVPRGGSSNATIKIGTDGTLQESTGGVQDQLPATIATGLGTLLTAAGTLGGVALTANASVEAAKIAAAATLGTTNRLLYAIEPRPNPEPRPRGEPPETALLGLNAQISSGVYAYAIGIQWPFAQFRHPGSGAPAPAPVTPSNVCSNPCFSNDPNQLVLNECTITFDTVDANPATPAPEKKKPAKAESGKDE